MNGFVSFLKEEELEFETGKRLSSCASIGIGGAAELFVTPKSKELFTKTLVFLKNNRIPFFITGNMTNLLPSDMPINKVIVSTLKLNTFTIFDDVLEAEAGALFSKTILHARDRSLGGYENLFGIPGTVGAMIRNNAGAYGSEISDLLISVDVYDCVDDLVFTLKKDEISFYYRDSDIKRRGLVVLKAKFRLLRSERNAIINKISDVRRKRITSQPISHKTLGSVFKRTENVSASFLIDSCGLKGYSVGGISVSDKHAGFFINDGTGTSEDFLKLCDIVKQEVKERYGIVLSEEFERLE